MNSNHPKTSLKFQITYWFDKTKPNKPSDQPKILSKSCYEIFLKNFQQNFYWLTDWLPDCLMPSVKHNSITANATSLIILLFNVTSAQDMPFGIPQYVQCILHRLTSVLICVPFIFADSEKCQCGGCMWWLPCMRNGKSSVFFIVAILITEVLFD